VPEDHGCLAQFEQGIGDAAVAGDEAALEHESLAGMDHLEHGHAAGLYGSDPSPAWLERREVTKG